MACRPTLTAAPKSTPPTLSGTVNEYQLSGEVAMVGVDDSSLQADSQVGQLGPRVGIYLALFYIHQMN